MAGWLNLIPFSITETITLVAGDNKTRGVDLLNVDIKKVSDYPQLIDVSEIREDSRV